MAASRQVVGGPVVIGAQQKDLRIRFLEFAADHFGKLAQGEKPVKPDPFVAEICATICAETVGAEVPLPLVRPSKLGRPKQERAASSILPDIGPPTGPFKPRPEAEGWLRAHGYTTVFKNTVHLLSAFLGYPDSWWTTVDLANHMKRSRQSVTKVCGELRGKGILVSRGARTNMRWKLAESPPRV